MATIVITLIVVAFALLFFVIVYDTPKKTPAVENPKYDPEMVKFLAENGLTQQQIIATMERRNQIK